MNRITQCLHGRGTVSAVMKHRSQPQGTVPSQYLGFSTMPRPVVFWNLTDQCNLSCMHCYSRSGPGRNAGEELSTEEACAVIDDLGAMGVPLILLSGGEPLLRPDIWELADHATSKGIRLAMSTNGTMITAEIAKRIREHGIEYAGISLDGATASTHDRVRCSPGAFDRSVAAFAHCHAAGVRCGVRVTLTRENNAELEALIDLALSLGAARFCLYWLVPSGRGRDAYEQVQLGPKEVQEALDILYRRARDAEPGIIEFLTVDAPQDCVHLLRAMEEDGSEDLEDAQALLASLKGGCSAGYRVANIDPFGNVYPCQFARLPEFLVGNVRETPFSTLWANSTHPVLARFRNRDARVGGKCSSCGYFEFCGGGCRVRAHAKDGDLSAEDPFCYLE